MSAFIAGSQDAFSEIYRRYSPRVYGFIRRRMSREALVDETFQDVFLKLTKSRHTFTEGHSFSPWLFSVINNAITDTLRREKSSLRATEALGQEPEPTLEAESSSPSLETLLSGLTEKDRAILSLRYTDDLPFEGVASRLGISVANARQIASRAIKKLRGDLQ